MHYFIDGYNLLFRLTHKGNDLQSQRTAIIRDISQKISMVGLEASIIFDGAAQPGEGSHYHIESCEVVFTGKGISADDYIILQIDHSRKPHQKIVVSSDKKLTASTRSLGAQAKSIEEFIPWLNQVYEKRRTKSKSHIVKKKKTLDLVVEPPPPPKKLILTDFDRWLKIFERQLNQEELE